MTALLVIGATGSIGRQVVEEATARGMAVRAFTRDAGRARRVLGDIDIVPGDLTNPDDLTTALAGMDAVILTHGGDSEPRRIYYGGIAALLVALGERRLPIALMSSINVSRPPSGPYADLMRWKLRGEDLLRDSGQPYTVIRPGWFDAPESGTPASSSGRATRSARAGCDVGTSRKHSSPRSSPRRPGRAPWRSSPAPASPSPTGTPSTPPRQPTPPTGSARQRRHVQHDRNTFPTRQKR